LSFEQGKDICRAGEYLSRARLVVRSYFVYQGAHLKARPVSVVQNRLSLSTVARLVA
jgi:hypothetical protein